MVGQRPTKSQHGDLTGTVVAADGDVGVEPSLVLARSGDQGDDPHRVLPCGRHGRGRGVRLVLLIGEDEQRQHHPRGS